MVTPEQHCVGNDFRFHCLLLQSYKAAGLQVFGTKRSNIIKNFSQSLTWAFC